MISRLFIGFRGSGFKVQPSRALPHALCPKGSLMVARLVSCRSLCGAMLSLQEIYLQEHLGAGINPAATLKSR